VLHLEHSFELWWSLDTAESGPENAWKVLKCGAGMEKIS
jgi:hypothetical protein